MSQINPSNAENEEFLNYLNLPKWKDEQVVALDSPFFPFFFDYFVLDFQNIKQKQTQKQAGSDVLQKKQLIQTNMHNAKQHKTEHQKLE